MPTIFLDYSTAHLFPSSLKAQGITGVGRYISDFPAKNLTVPERDSLFMVNLQIFLIFENGAADATGGWTVGISHGNKGNAYSDALAYPHTCPIFYAIDFPAKVGSVDDYFKGIRSVTTRPIGGYGPRLVVEDLLARGLIDFAWQSAGWNAGGLTSTTCHLCQQVTPLNPIPGTDTNVVLRSFPTWSKPLPTPIPVPSKPTPKPVPKPIPVPVPAPPKVGLQVQTIDMRNVTPVASTWLRGPNIAPMQRLLGVSPADGIGGPATLQALENAQWRMFKVIDRIFGDQTAEGLLAGR